MKKREMRAQIVIVQNGQYILLKHHHIKEKRYFWGLPGGGVEENETVEEAAIREAKEETGLEISLLPFKYEVSFDEKERLYNKKTTLVGYPVKGNAVLGYDPEDDLRLLYELCDLKWHPVKDIIQIDDYTKSDILPIKHYLEHNDFIKRAGALVYKKENDEYKYLVVSMNVHHDWYTLPQGHVEVNESYQDTAKRETEEEAGVLIEVEEELGYFFYEQNHICQTYIYLGKYIEETKMNENRIVKWVSYNESEKLNMPKEARRFIKETDEKLRRAYDRA